MPGNPRENIPGSNVTQRPETFLMPRCILQGESRHLVRSDSCDLPKNICTLQVLLNSLQYVRMTLADTSRRRPSNSSLSNDALEHHRTTCSLVHKPMLQAVDARSKFLHWGKSIAAHKALAFRPRCKFRLETLIRKLVLSSLVNDLGSLPMCTSDQFLSSKVHITVF